MDSSTIEGLKLLMDGGSVVVFLAGVWVIWNTLKAERALWRQDLIDARKEIRDLYTMERDRLNTRIVILEDRVEALILLEKGIDPTRAVLHPRAPFPEDATAYQTNGNG
ncbi:MAG: hypothetical protein J0M33_23965 [Anaerolineae bacterium]|nr:hypothetical protein [Anaerolineae bacterium]